MEAVIDRSSSLVGHVSFDRRKHGRSRVKNNGDILPDVDGRTFIARRYREIARAILIDVGGEECCTEVRWQLIRRFAAAAVISEQIEVRLAKGEAVNLAEHAVLSSVLVRLASRIGLNRVARYVGGFDLGTLMMRDIAARRDAEATGTAVDADPLISDARNGAEGHGE
jgi:hypothetical protein